MTDEWQWPPPNYWPDDYSQREEELRRFGLKVKVAFSICDDFVSLQVQVLEGRCLSEKTPWPLHITMGYAGEIGEDLLCKLREKWHQQLTHLKFEWVSARGVAFLDNCDVSSCALVKEVHDKGCYKDRQLHISF